MRNFDFIKRHRRQLQAGLERDFARAREAVPALALYATPADAGIRALRNTSDDAARAVLTEALLLAVRSGHPALSSALLLGFLPMLEYVLSFGKGFIDDGDLSESMVLEAFTESVAGYRGLLPNPHLYLHRETRRLYIRAARRFNRDRTRIDLVGAKELDRHRQGWWDSHPEGDQASLGLRASLAECGADLTELLESLVENELPSEELELVEATVLRGEDLVAYVDRMFPGLTGLERKRAYGRVQRQRNRTLHVLRDLLGSWRAEVIGEREATLPPVETAPTPPAPVLSPSRAPFVSVPSTSNASAVERASP